MTSEDRQKLIAEHQRIKLTEIDVLRRMSLTLNDASDETMIRQFCGSKGKTLPDMIEIEVIPFESDDPKVVEQYEWHINIYENPNEREGSNS